MISSLLFKWSLVEGRTGRTRMRKIMEGKAAREHRELIFSIG